jgi:hypothetical protein
MKKDRCACMTLMLRAGMAVECQCRLGMEQSCVDRAVRTKAAGQWWSDWGGGSQPADSTSDCHSPV